MAFTEVEMAILSRCAYLELDKKCEGQSLHAFLTDKENKKELLNKLGGEYKSALNDLIEKTEGKDYTIVKAQDDANKTGFAAFAVKDPGNGVTVACRGTEFNTAEDIVADFQLAYEMQSLQQEKMDAFVNSLEKQGYDSYSFTGHSLGGNLAMYGAMSLDNPSTLDTSVTFNAPGFNAGFLSQNKARIDRIEDRMTNFQNERDCVSECFSVPGQVVILECKGLDFLQAVGIKPHGLDMLEVKKNGTFKRNHTGRKDVTLLGYLLDRVTDESDRWVWINTKLRQLFGKSDNSFSGRQHGGSSHSGGGRSFGGGGRRISLTPAELKQQASQLQSLSEEFSQLFSNVVRDLHGVNGNWSVNLAHNFSGKITSAQNRFAAITQTLSDGAKVAETSATTFESVDSQLAKLTYSDTKKS